LDDVDSDLEDDMDSQLTDGHALGCAFNSDPSTPDFRNDPTLLEYLGEFSDFFLQLASMDKEYAARCGQSYITFLEGPPNRRTKDGRGYLPSIIALMKSQVHPNYFFVNWEE
jgi:hypothetical protein